MLDNAFKYKDEIQKLMYDTWYDEKYMFYHASTERTEFEMSTGAYGNGRQFASVRNKDGKTEVIGLISYTVDTEVSRARHFGAINFTDDIYTMGRDISQAVDDIFCKFNLNSLEWFCITGNPVERSYDRLVNIYGGRIVGVFNDAVKTMDGVIRDDKMYEILRADYMLAKERMARKLHR